MSSRGLSLDQINKSIKECLTHAGPGKALLENTHPQKTHRPAPALGQDGDGDPEPDISPVCPYCDCIAETEAVFCDLCQNWLHKDCEQMSTDVYRSLSEGGNHHQDGYICGICLTFEDITEGNSTTRDDTALPTTTDDAQDQTQRAQDPPSEETAGATAVTGIVELIPYRRTPPNTDKHPERDSRAVKTPEQSYAPLPHP